MSLEPEACHAAAGGRTEVGVSQIAATGKAINTPSQVLFASLVGTTIEFFDFYIYATAAVLVFPRLFFPASDPMSATLASLATFAIAFLARPTGAKNNKQAVNLNDQVAVRHLDPNVSLDPKCV